MCDEDDCQDSDDFEQYYDRSEDGGIKTDVLEIEIQGKVFTTKITKAMGMLFKVVAPVEQVNSDLLACVLIDSIGIASQLSGEKEVSDEQFCQVFNHFDRTLNDMRVLWAVCAGVAVPSYSDEEGLMLKMVPHKGLEGIGEVLDGLFNSKE